MLYCKVEVSGTSPSLVQRSPAECVFVLCVKTPLHIPSESRKRSEQERKEVLIIKPTRCTNFSNLFFGIKLYTFQTVPLSIIGSSSLYTQEWYTSYRLQLQLASRIRTEVQFRPDPARKLSANLYDIYHCCVYSEELPMMDRGTV